MVFTPDRDHALRYIYVKMSPAKRSFTFAITDDGPGSDLSNFLLAAAVVAFRD
jgi:hypothetical protein